MLVLSVATLLVVIVFSLARVEWVVYQYTNPVYKLDGHVSVTPGHISGADTIVLGGVHTGRLPEEGLIEAIRAQRFNRAFEHLGLDTQVVTTGIAEAIESVGVEQLDVSDCEIEAGAFGILLDTPGLKWVWCDDRYVSVFKDASRKSPGRRSVRVLAY